MTATEILEAGDSAGDVEEADSVTGPSSSGRAAPFRKTIREIETEKRRKVSSADWRLAAEDVEANVAKGVCPRCQERIRTDDESFIARGGGQTSKRRGVDAGDRGRRADPIGDWGTARYHI